MSIATGVPANSKPRKYDDWEISDAMHTMLRAGEIVADKKLMGLVKKKAAEHASKMQGVAKQAAQLAKQGRISPKQMAKLSDAASTNLAKTKPIA
jgi:dTDP-glucose pyrophosphorylase